MSWEKRVLRETCLGRNVSSEKRVLRETCLERNVSWEKRVLGVHTTVWFTAYQAGVAIVSHVNSVVSLDEMMRGEENLAFYTVTRRTRQMRWRWRQTRRRWRQIRRIWTDFDAFLRRNGKRARGELEPIKKIKNKTDVSLYFVLRVCVSSSNKTCWKILKFRQN